MPSDSIVTAQGNALAALTLLAGLQRLGVEHVVLCPGSRSAPLAVAAALLEKHRGLQLHTAIDERSAAFFALGLSRAQGRPAAVVTTSGTAVAQLLPAAVEADLSTIPLLLLSADRPAALKACGANQAVPQEHFLVASRRRLLEGPPSGLASCSADDLDRLAAEAMAAAHGDGLHAPAGPVHLNLPFEEPLHAAGEDLAALALRLAPSLSPAPIPHSPLRPSAPALGAWAIGSSSLPIEARLDPERPGVVVAGPWRGTPGDWQDHCRALRRWQGRSGWPVLADPLSGLRGLADLKVVAAYDPLLEEPLEDLAVPQVLRLGSLPASRCLQRWLETCGGHQVLVSQGDPRRLDPLGTVRAAGQWSGGLVAWVEAVLADRPVVPLRTASAGALPQGTVSSGEPTTGLSTRLDQATAVGEATAVGQATGGDDRTAREDGTALSDRAVPQSTRRLAEHWQRLEAAAQEVLERELPVSAAVRAPEASSPPGGAPLPRVPIREPQVALSEPWLARALSRLLPAGHPLMLASSSPVRDWESFADGRGDWHPVHGFRGASGIDGTLSIACGLAEALGRLVLVSGDLALLHDANGWLWARQLRGQLTVVLIENGGGGIFEQLPIRTEPPGQLDFERLFAMPQGLDQLALASLHGVPGRRLERKQDLERDLAWSLAQPFSILEVRTNRQDDAALRQRLRRAVSAEAASIGRMARRDLQQ
ncbi:MAG: 2-succinyl-5-enolpyruvyl-6-hydroxy-3-cyclohexene-1-carboxylic-acid synthase [Cyanobium sp.]